MYPFTSGNPLPRRRRTLPLWVPGSMLIFAFPSTVGTSMLQPRMASVTLMARLYITWFSWRSSSGCFSSSTRISKSPSIPPPGAALPLPLMDNCIPSCTPAGILMVVSISSCTKPCSLAPTGLLDKVLPLPPQCGQAETVCI